MIELVTVEVTNFRSFSHAVFEPLGIGQGMTAINGANGMGKSSIVHALVWALYGITPDGVRVGALRRQDSEGDVEVKVTLRHDGQTVVVTRAIRGKNDTTVASIEVDGVEQTNVSSKTATNWIATRFGLDAEAFLTAFVVRQKELDSLVRARPAERRKTIERLAGIERMSKALELARAEARLAQKTYDALPPIPSSLDLESEKDELAEIISTLTSQKEELSKSLEASKNKVSSIQSELNNAKTASRLVSELEGKLDLEESRLSDLTEKYNSALELSKLAVGSEDLQEESTNVENAILAINSKIDLAREHTQSVSRLNDQIIRLKEQSNKLILEKQTFVTQSNSLDISKLNLEIEELNVNLSGLIEAEQNLTGRKGAARGEWDRLKKALDTLSSHSHASEQAKCPTCNNDILDVEVLINSLNASIATVETEGKQINVELLATQANIQDIRAEIRTVEEKISLASSLQERAAELGSQIEEVENNIQDSEEELSKINITSYNMSELLEKKKNLEVRQRSILTNLAKLEDAINAKNALSELKASVTAKKDLVEELASGYEKAKKEALSYDVDALEEEYDAEVEALEAIDSELRGITTNIAINNNQLTNVENTLSSIEIEEQRRKVLLAEVESKTAAATTLDEFRRDRLARLTPELSEVASDFVSRMTDGKYTSVLLDEDFTPILTDASGAERPVAWLSGGEESAVALALRVAIGEVLAGQRGGLLVLDEALTAQDASRRQATMGAIRALPRQIITINHISEATDMVDLVAEVVASDEGGSTIQEVVPDDGKVGIVSDSAIDA